MTSAIIGASNLTQLDQSVAALETNPFTDDEIAALEKLAAHSAPLP
ncbi:hypothetical protein [Rathayibacter toxicus]|nr:hypothetical protein [Rathayibacter toxicus]